MIWIKAQATPIGQAELVTLLRSPTVIHPMSSTARALAVLLALTLQACASPPAATQAPTEVEVEPVVLDVGRGRLLYDTHCVTCHDREVHWRDRSIVGAWSDLLVQVDRWQSNTGQRWTSAEIGDVAAYLNAIYYRMPCPGVGCSGASTATGPAATTSEVGREQPEDRIAHARQHAHPMELAERQRPAGAREGIEVRLEP